MSKLTTVLVCPAQWVSGDFRLDAHGRSRASSPDCGPGGGEEGDSGEFSTPHHVSSTSGFVRAVPAGCRL